MSRLSLVLVLAWCFAATLPANGGHIDSLLLKLEKASRPEEKADLLNELSFTLFDNDAEKAYIYADQALNISIESNYLNGKRQALTLKGYYFFDKGDFSKALGLFREGVQVRAPADAALGYNLVLTGNLYRTIASYDSALLYYQKAIDLLIKEKAHRHLAYAYKNIGRLYILQWKNDAAEKAFQKAGQLYEQLGSSFGKSEMAFAMADLMRNLGEYQKADDYINTGCKLAEKLDDQYLNHQCQLGRAEIKFKLGEFIPALDGLLDVLEKLQKQDKPRTLIRVYSALGDVYEVLGQNDVALRYFMEALKLSENLGMKFETGKALANLAWVYKNQKRYSPAFDFLNRSLKIREEIGDTYGIGSAYNVKGVIYLQQKKYDEAVKWIERAREVRSAIGHTEGVAACYYNLGMVYEEQKNYREALRYQLKAYEFEKNTGNKFNIGIAFSSIGSVYTYLNKFDSARYYLEKADEIGRQTGSVELQMETCYYWSEFYEHQGDHKEALIWHKRYSQLNDSVYHEASANRLAEMQALYQTDQKDKAITILNREKSMQADQLQLQRAQLSLQTYVILFVFVALVLVSLLAYKTYKYNREMKAAHKEILERKEELQSQSEELQQAYQTIAESHKELEGKVEERTFALREAYRELDTFFYRASHDFRRPLTTFLGLAEVAKITLTDPNAKELFNKVRETAINLDKMLLKLQSISDLGSRQLAYGQVDMSQLIGRVLEQFQEQLGEKNIHTASTCVMHSPFYSYGDMIYIILENLVENSIAFCRYHGAFIKLSAIQKGERVIVEVEDNGDGIESRYHAKIFEMYFRGNDRSKGNGLGLYIIKKALDKLDGVMSFTSERDKGTHFVISFPLSLRPSLVHEEEAVERMHL